MFKIIIPNPLQLSHLVIVLGHNKFNKYGLAIKRSKEAGNIMFTKILNC